VVAANGIVAEVLRKFSIDMINDDDDFISLLFYMGLITIQEPYLQKLKLCIPNYTIKTIYWEYIMRLLRETIPSIAPFQQSHRFESRRHRVYRQK
jgi:hypothetical protein